MTVHRFECSDTPGVFECPACKASAHYEREEGRYCIHPADGESPAWLVDNWKDPTIGLAHELGKGER